MVNCADKMCEDHKKTFIAVCGFYCAVLIIIVGYMVSNDSRARAAEVLFNDRLGTTELTSAQQHAEMMERTLSHIDEMKSEMLQRISRVEAKLEMKP